MEMDNLLKKYIFVNEETNDFVQNIDFSKTPILEVENIIHNPQYLDELDHKKLHDYIFKFYAYNEILSAYKQKNNEIINEEHLRTFKEYGLFINDFSKSIFSFILYACLAESRHTDLFSGFKMNNYNLEYVYDLRKEYSEKAVNNFFNNEKNIGFNYFQIFIDKIKEKYTDEKYKNITQNETDLKQSFLEFLHEIGLLHNDVDINFKQLVDNNYIKKNSHKFSSIMKDHIKKIFSDHCEENGEIINPQKMKNFEFFEDFMIKISQIQEYNMDGDAHRKIITSQMIKNSDIKDIPAEEMFEFLSIFFIQSFKEKKGFGGKPWSDIAKHALSFARGEISAEIFIDQSLSMEHNNGNMFNKNFIFEDIDALHYIDVFKHDENVYSQPITIKLNTNDFILNLQSSSSVLSLCNFYNNQEDWETLTENFTHQHTREISLSLNNSNMSRFKQNFKSFTNLSTFFKSIPEIINVAQNLGYSIPKINFNNIVSAYKKKHPEFFEYITPKDIQINNLFDDIVHGKYLKKVETSFKLHDLNLNNSKHLTKELIGGKAYGLANLINKGFNVPKALVFDTQTCLSYIDNKEHFNEEYKKVDKKISDYLINDKKEPLLVSVRSGAAVSMPGMMDSILNVGIDNKTFPTLCKVYGQDVIEDCAISFIKQFCNSKFGHIVKIENSNNMHSALNNFKNVLDKKNILYDENSYFPLSKEEQIKLSVEAVFDSWNSPRAIAWRNEKNISHEMGTAATVQQMVFGNKNNKSLTCVIFSRDCITGKTDIMGEYLPQAQGEDLVSGKKTPLPISQLKISNPKIYQEIEFIAKTLEEEQKAIQDIEITVEDGKVYVLQMRNAVVSPEAQLALATEMNLNLIDVVPPKSLIGEAKVDTNLEANYNGLAASPGLISGIIVRNQEDIDKYKNEGKDLIFFSNQALPEHAPIMIATQGFITEFGGATSHAAILARSMGKPCVVGIGKQESNNLESGSIVTIDASEGKVWNNELPIVINQDKAIKLANQILKDNNIIVSKNLVERSLLLRGWTTSLSSYKVLQQPLNNKHKMFLNIAQKTALLLQKEHNQSQNKKMIIA